MHRDTVIGIVGVIILVAAMVGVFTYESGQAAQLDGAVGTLTTLSGPGLSDTTDVGQTTEQLLALEQTGMTNVTFTLAWTASAGSDTLQLVVVGPDGSGINATESDPESDGEITLTVPIPNTAASGTTGVGNWSISVQFVSADSGLPVPAPVPGQTDTSVTWELSTSLQAYATEE